MLVHLPILLIRGLGSGVWLFYVQHQFEADGHGRNNADWNVHAAGGLSTAARHDGPAGISPGFTGPLSPQYSAINHVHHLCQQHSPTIRCPGAARNHSSAARRQVAMTMLQSFSCVRLVLWEETQRAGWFHFARGGTCASLRRDADLAMVTLIWPLPSLR